MLEIQYKEYKTPRMVLPKNKSATGAHDFYAVGWSIWSSKLMEGATEQRRSSINQSKLKNESANDH